MEAILAHEQAGGIGFENTLPWDHNKVDMQHFVNVTRGKTVVMGYKTFESIGGKPLTKRRNIVLSRSGRELEGVEVMTLEEFMEMEEAHEETVVIGGAEIYNQMLKHCDTVYVTTFLQRYQCDAFIDPFYFMDNYSDWEALHDDGHIKIMRYSSRTSD